jgi:CRISPR-associated endonuclease/helicase Cas3
MMAPAFRLCESHPGKPLTGHLQDVADRLTAHGSLGRLAGLFHDVAKGTEHFQHYLKGEPFSDRLKQHAHLGAFWLLSHLLPKVAAVDLAIDQAVLAYLMVAHHHTGLKNALDSLPPLKGDAARELWAKQIQALDVDGAIYWLAAALGEPVQKPNLDLHWTKVRLQLSAAFRRAPSGLPAMHRFQNALRWFGQLIEADRDSATGFAPDLFKAPPRFTMAHLERFRAAANYGPTADPRVVQARDLVYQAAVAGAVAQPVGSGHLWSLTVPTGAGKTLAAMGWALRRREARVATGLPPCPIIYALPFTSIIDQNALVLRRVWGDDEPDESTLAVHHHVAEPGELARSGEQSLARSWVEGWRADIICTTFVQVVNALFHGTVADARRFAGLAGSILILDEVQAIPAKFWRLINAALRTLSSQWGTDVLLVTATQPAIFEQTEVKELRPALAEMLAAAFDRYDLHVQTKQVVSVTALADRVRGVVTDQGQPSCLVIVNTIQEALDLYALVLTLPGVGDNPVFHLSTNLRPKDRKRILQQIAKCHGRPHVLIATQVVEAGVDLSFDVVFRALAPLDAIVQAAGRCNRHGTGRRGKVFLIRLEGDTGNMIYGDKAIGAARDVLERAAAQGVPVPEPELQESVGEYFRLVASRTGSDTFQKVMEAIQKWEFAFLRGEGSEAKDRDKAVRLIDERNDTIAHYVEIDASDADVWQQFLGAKSLPDLHERRRKLRQIGPLLGQRIVEIPQAFALSSGVNVDDVVHVPQTIAPDLYSLDTGWKRKRN